MHWMIFCPIRENKIEIYIISVKIYKDQTIKKEETIHE